MTISNPTMSRNAVAISTMSFAGIFRSSRANVYSNATASAPRATRTTGDSSDVAMSRIIESEVYNESVDGFAECRGLHRPTYDAGKRDNGEDVRNHLNEL